VKRQQAECGRCTNHGGQGLSYDYDRYGNRWHQNVTQGQGPAPQYTFDNSTNRISGSGVTYDALGNVTNDGFHAYAYDAEGRLITVDGGTTATYVYDAEQRRVRGPSQEYLYDLAGNAVTMLSLTGVWNFTDIYAGGRHLATYSGGTTNFLHADWLGTKRVMTGVNAAVSQTCTGLPFGDGVTCTPTTNWTYNGFTDDIHDSETNLEHTWFRQLSGTQGRWTTPDPYLGSMDLTNPQSLNRYAYVMNNPINLTDPSGLVCGGGDYDDCFWNYLAGMFGGGGGCTVNGIGAPCSLANGLVNGGTGARCDGDDCSKIRVGSNGQWQVFIQWPGPSVEDPDRFFYSVSVVGHWFDLDTPIAYLSGVRPVVVPSGPVVKPLPPLAPPPSLNKITNSHSYAEFLACTIPQGIELYQKNGKALAFLVTAGEAGALSRKPWITVTSLAVFASLTVAPALRTRDECNEQVGGVIPNPFK
jgi:RHS repeat-associated protein